MIGPLVVIKGSKILEGPRRESIMRTGDLSEKDNALLTDVVLEISTIVEEPSSLNEFE